MNSLIVLIILFGHYHSSKSSSRISEDDQQYRYVSTTEAEECTRIMASIGNSTTDKIAFINLFNSHPSVNNNAKKKVLKKIRKYPNGMEFYDTTMMQCLNLQKKPPNRCEQLCLCLYN